MGIADAGISLIPVLFFLVTLVVLDSYKLVRVRSVLFFVLTGCGAGITCYVITSWSLNTFGIPISVYTQVIAPVLEELVKGSCLYYLLKNDKIGFMVDAAIYGFAVGAGFAVIENSEYLINLPSGGMFLWIIRGFGTAVMHGGTVALMAISAKSISDRSGRVQLYHFLPGLAGAIIIHSFFNHLILDPRLITVIQLVLMPLAFILVFTRSEVLLRAWLEQGLDSDVTALEIITKGSVSDTNIGVYLHSLGERFTGLVLADMLCYLRIHLELAVRAKGILLAQGAGFGIARDVEVEKKLEELAYLEKAIGKTGKIALAPLIHTSTRDLWQIYLVKKA
ncbi:PrsW family intramembrane metalloprotease [bacterium]|nr:PrsW family intramembrane metalloprotease [bacterium]